MKEGTSFPAPGPRKPRASSLTTSALEPLRIVLKESAHLSRIMTMEKQTSKREFRFVIDTVANALTIVNANNERLRVFPLNKLTEGDVPALLPLHGLKQKMTDDTMVSKIGEDGDRLLACDDLWAQLLSGQWEKEREGIARPPEALIVFIMEKKSLTRAVAEASLKQAGKDKWEAIKAAWAKDIAAIEARIKADKAKAEAIDLTNL